MQVVCRSRAVRPTHFGYIAAIPVRPWSNPSSFPLVPSLLRAQYIYGYKIGDRAQLHVTLFCSSSPTNRKALSIAWDRAYQLTSKRITATITTLLY